MSFRKHYPKSRANRGNKDDLGLSRRPSFFKVILNHEYLDTLRLPPKFAKRLRLLPNQKIQIKDTTGRYWRVTLSDVEDHIAFGRGWHAFVLDHGIEISDIVTVVHISDSDLICKIFGKNGCPKRQFPSASCNTASLDSTHKDSSTFSNSRVNVTFTQRNKERSSTSHGERLRRKPFEDPCCIVNRDNCVDGRSLLDQSEFEMCRAVSEMGSSSFVDDLVDFSAFDEAMRISSDMGNKDSSKHETSGQVLPETCPSASVEPSVEEQTTGAFQIETTTIKDQGPSLEAQTAAFQDQTTKITDQGPSLDPQTAAFPCQTATPRDEGPLVEAQTIDLEAQTAAFQGQTTTLRYQDTVNDPERNGFNRGESVTMANNQNTKFNPEGFGGSVRNVKEEHKMLNPKGFGGGVRMVKEEQMKFNPKTSGPSMEAQTAAFHAGGSVRNVKKEHKMLNSEGLGGVRIVKEERMEFNPKTVGGVAQRVQGKYMTRSFGGAEIAGKVKKESMNFNPEPFGDKHNSIGHQGGNGTFQVLKRVKTEAADFVELPPPLAVTCLATTDDNFLVLPTDFSLLGYKRIMDLEKKVVILRDPAQKLWPLLCCKIDGLQVLTSGWKSFREANGIQAGDECVFQVEDKFENIFKVNVVRKA